MQRELSKPEWGHGSPRARSAAKVAGVAIAFVALVLVGSGGGPGMGMGSWAGTVVAPAVVASSSAVGPAPPSPAEPASSAAADAGASDGNASPGDGEALRGDGGAGVTPDGRVVLNLATEDDLRRLPGVGPVKARAILALRDRLGRFRRPEDLLKVRGIGRRSLARLKPLVVVDPP